jgi:hypothetical protein
MHSIFSSVKGQRELLALQSMPMDVRPSLRSLSAAFEPAVGARHYCKRDGKGLVGVVQKRLEGVGGAAGCCCREDG